MGKIATLLSLLLLAMSCQAMQRVIHPSVTDVHAARFNDLFEILELALDKTQEDFGEFELIPTSLSMTESRLLQEVKKGKIIDVIWSSTSPKKEKELIPIRIPLRKGILGYRISFIHKSEQANFNKVNDLNDLRQFRIGQGIGWGDINIYKHNNIIVGQAPYESLFGLIGPNRFNLFPRGISEIFNEMAIYTEANPSLSIEESIVLYYPWPYYFFTSKGNEKLAMRIETGLERMIKDGSFDRIFLKYNNSSIKQSRLDERRLIRLENPFLPDNTPLDRKELWFVPTKKPMH